MEEYYWEYWESDEVYSGTLTAFDEHVAYQLIQDVLHNGVATVQSGGTVGVWSFTEIENVNPNSQQKQFSESDMGDVLGRKNSDSTVYVDRDD
jgi:hypothetical protein